MHLVSESNPSIENVFTGTGGANEVLPSSMWTLNGVCSLRLDSCYIGYWGDSGTGGREVV